MPTLPKTFRRPGIPKPREDRGGQDRTVLNTQRWRRLSRMTLNANPLCDCGEAATDVDHVIPREERPDLAYDPDNLKARCHSCHSKKTAEDKKRRKESQDREDG